MTEPLLTGEFIVGRTRFRPKVKLSTAQGSVDRLFTRYEQMEAVLYQVKEFEARLPESLRTKVNRALGLGGDGESVK
jgi:hypothetical protein